MGAPQALARPTFDKDQDSSIIQGLIELVAQAAGFFQCLAHQLLLRNAQSVFLARLSGRDGDDGYFVTVFAEQLLTH